VCNIYTLVLLSFYLNLYGDESSPEMGQRLEEEERGLI